MCTHKSQVLATDWNEHVRAAAVRELANAAKCDDDGAVGTLVEALKVVLCLAAPMQAFAIRAALLRERMKLG